MFASPAVRASKGPAVKRPPQKRVPKGAPVQELAARSGAPVHAAPAEIVQAKLEVSKPGDELEKEADAVAEQVMRAPEGALPDQMPGRSRSSRASPVSRTVFRACDTCASEDESDGDVMQRKAAGSAPLLSHAFETRFSHVRSRGGEPLRGELRGFMEQRLGQDFGAVRVHRSAEASELARAAHARAFTMGRDVFFRSGEFRPESPRGKRLIAHELAHVVQQGAATGTVRRAVEPNEQMCTVASGPDATAFGRDERLTLIRLAKPGTNTALLGRAVSRGRGDPRHATKLVQQALQKWACQELGIDVLPKFGADGSFGGETERAVKTFQEAQSIKVDGIVGPETLTKLDAIVFGAGATVARVTQEIGTTPQTEGPQPVVLGENEALAVPVGNFGPISTACMAASLLLSPVAASAFGTIAEALIETDYCSVMGCSPFATDFFDNPIAASYIGFLAANNPHLDTPANIALLAIQSAVGGVPRPDILTHKAVRKEFYEIKSDSVPGRAAGRAKLLGIEAFMGLWGLPYVDGTRYTPASIIPLRTVGIGGLTVDVFLRVRLAQPGLVVYEVCFRGPLQFITATALAAALAALIIILAPEVIVFAPALAAAKPQKPGPEPILV